MCLLSREAILNHTFLPQHPNTHWQQTGGARRGELRMADAHTHPHTTKHLNTPRGLSHVPRDASFVNRALHKPRVLNKAGSEDRREDERQRRGRKKDLRGDVPSGAAPSFVRETKVDRDLGAASHPWRRADV